MNIVIDNYTTTEDTQALYFNNSLLSLGYNSRLFESKRESLYDVFDKHKPDIYITHAFRITNDLLHYIVNNQAKIDVLVNVQGMSKENISNLSDTFNKNNIISSFFFLNTENSNIPNIRDRNIINICSAADTNLLNQKNTITYKIKKAIILYNKESIKEYDGSYHNISMLESMKGLVDIILPEIILGPLYSCYDEVVFRDFNGYLPQGLFDAIIFGCKVYFDIDDDKNRNELESMINKILKPEASLIFSDKNKLQDFTNLRAFVMEKHTNNNRTKTLLSNIRTKK